MRSALIAAVLGVCIVLSPAAAQAAVHPAVGAACTAAPGSTSYECVSDAGTSTARTTPLEGQGLLTAWIGGGMLMLAAGGVTLATSTRRMRKQASATN